MYQPLIIRITRVIAHLVCALLILFTSQVVAQTIYPIRSIATLAGSAPYTLDEYVSQEGKLQVQIITDDVTLAQYAVKLRLTLESADVKITTSTAYLPQPIYLEGGMMEIFTATDLAPLFSVNNLTFEGAITKSQYQRVGKLPEGTYRIKVDVLDYYRNVVVSKTTSAIGMVYMTKAPKLSFPASGTEIDVATSPQVRFNWMTFHAINPDAEIVHRFRIWELQPANRNPYEIINAITPIYQEDVTLGANLTLSPDILLLIPGRTYVWQVQAVDLQNKVLYQNSGKSDAYTFRYGKSCITPSPTLIKVGTTETQIGWSGNINTQQYEVRYKIATDTDWKLATTKLANYTILAQTDNTNYQVNVTAVCGTEQSAPSHTLEFKTNRTVDYTCGTGAAQFDLSNKAPLPALVKYDEFKAADFIIEVTEATGSNGQFTGKGLALVPYLGFAKFKVEFDDITINTDRRMVAGEVRFVYDEKTGMIIGLGGSGNPEEVVFVDNLKEQYTQLITTTQEVQKVEVKDSTVTITFADGSTQKVTASKKGDTVAIITPSKTTAYVADTNSGMVYTSPLPSKSEASNSASVASASQTKQYGSSVTITPSKTQQFGFDVVGNGTDKPNSYFLKNKSAQAVAWKSLKAGANDYVDVTATGASIDSLRYLRESGMATPSTALPKGRQLLLTGSADGEEELLTIALSTTKMGKDSTIKQTLTELGALGLVSYDPIVREVILVPVNDAQAPSSSSAIQTTLNTIFAPAVVSWKVTMGLPLTVTGITPEGFSTTGLNLASRYTTDMKAVIKAYKAINNISSNTLVLFFVKATNADKLGYMPLTGNYGFIFNLGSNIELLAHELSHGAFNLKHTFSDISFWRESGAAPVFEEKSTHNLMDYAGGTELWKYQWDLIHDPQAMLFAFMQDEEEGAYIIDRWKLVRQYIDEFNGKTGTARTNYKFTYDNSKVAENFSTEAINQVNNLLTEYLKDNDEPVFLVLELFTHTEEKDVADIKSIVEQECLDILKEYPNTVLIPVIGCQLVNEGNAPIGDVEFYICKKVSEQKISQIGSYDDNWEDLEKENVSEEVAEFLEFLQSSPVFNDENCLELTYEELGISSASELNPNDVKEWVSAFAGDNGVSIDYSYTGYPVVTNSEIPTASVNQPENSNADINIALHFDDDGKKIIICHHYKAGAIVIPSVTASGESVQETTVDEIVGLSKVYAGKALDYAKSGGEKMQALFNSAVKGVVAAKTWTKTICDKMEVPQPVWNDMDNKEAYDRSPVHVEPILSGVGDGTFEELKSIPELITLALDVAFDKDIRTSLWNSIKSISWEDVKNMPMKMVKDKVAVYERGGAIAKHEGGKDGVQVASMVLGFGSLKKGKEIAEEVGEQFGKKIDDVVKKLPQVIKDDLGVLSEKTFGKIVKELGDDPKLLEELLNNPKLAKAWTHHKVPLPQSELDDLVELYTKSDVGDKVIGLIEEASSKKIFMELMDAARKYQKEIIERWTKELPDLVEEVSFDVILDGKTYRTRLDGVARSAGKFIVVEAKMGEAVFSEPQKMFMKALKEGIGEIKPVGQKAIEVFEDLEGTNVRHLLSKEIRLNDDIVDITTATVRGLK